MLTRCPVTCYKEIQDSNLWNIVIGQWQQIEESKTKSRILRWKPGLSFLHWYIIITKFVPHPSPLPPTQKKTFFRLSQTGVNLKKKKNAYIQNDGTCSYISFFLAWNQLYCQSWLAIRTNNLLETEKKNNRQKRWQNMKKQINNNKTSTKINRLLSKFHSGKENLFPL